MYKSPTSRRSYDVVMRGVAYPAVEALRRLIALDDQFHDVNGAETVTKKDLAVRGLVRILDQSGVRYAVIGGIDVHLWQSDPRTTLGVSVAVVSYDDVPHAALEAAGFRLRERHEHAENWIGPGGTPVQFTAGPEFAGVIANAVLQSICDEEFRIASALELVHAKLRAASDAARKRTKRLRDLADAEALLETDPSLHDQLSDEERLQLSRAL